MFTETDQPRAGPCGPAGGEAPEAELRPDESVTNALGQDLIELDIQVEDRPQRLKPRNKPPYDEAGFINVDRRRSTS